jgi:hypothetical protein
MYLNLSVTYTSSLFTTGLAVKWVVTLTTGLAVKWVVTLTTGLAVKWVVTLFDLVWFMLLNLQFSV